MKYTILIEKSVKKQLEKLSEPLYTKLKEAILNLAIEPRPDGCKKLTGRNAYRIRKGDYRIVYEIIDKTLLIHILSVGHRKDIYN